MRDLLTPVWLSITLCVPGCAPAQRSVLSQDLIISHWRHAEPNALDRVPGVDVDGRGGRANTDRCDDALDFLHDRRERADVDNQYSWTLLALLAGAYPSGVSRAVFEQLVRGERLLGLRIESEDETPRGGPVRVSLLSLHTTAPLSGSMDRLAPGAPATATTLATVIAQRDQDLLTARFAELDLPMGVRIDAVPVHGVIVELAIEPDGRVARGDLGGALTPEAAVEAAEAITPGVFDLATIRSIAMPDLEPNADGSLCAAISFGVGLEMVPVAIAP